MVFCVQCGTACPVETAKFCFSCGAALYTSTQPKPSAGPPSPRGGFRPGVGNGDSSAQRPTTTTTTTLVPKPATTPPRKIPTSPSRNVPVVTRSPPPNLSPSSPSSPSPPVPPLPRRTSPSTLSRSGPKTAARPQPVKTKSSPNLKQPPKSPVIPPRPANYGSSPEIALNNDLALAPQYCPSPTQQTRPRLATQLDLSNIYKNTATAGGESTSPTNSSDHTRQWKKKKEDYDSSNPDFAYTRKRTMTVNPYAQAPEVLAAAQSSDQGEGGSMFKGLMEKVGDLRAELPVPQISALLAPKEKEELTPEQQKQREEEEKAKAEAEKRKQKERQKQEDEYMNRVRRHRQGIFTTYGEPALPDDLLEKSNYGVFNSVLMGSKEMEVKKDKFISYEIKVRWGEVGWTIFRRYQQFHEFMVYLKKYSRVTLSTPLPPKSYFQSDDEEARQEGLVKWLDGVVKQQEQFFKNEKAEQALIKFFAPIQMGDIKAPRLKLPFTIQL